jgi:hypothetical protein
LPPFAATVPPTGRDGFLSGCHLNGTVTDGDGDGDA